MCSQHATDFVHCIAFVSAFCYFFISVSYHFCVNLFRLDLPSWYCENSTKLCASFPTSWVQVNSKVVIFFVFCYSFLLSIWFDAIHALLSMQCFPSYLLVCFSFNSVSLSCACNSLLFSFNFVTIVLFYAQHYYYSQRFATVVRAPACFAASVISLIIGFNGCECEWKVSNYK